MSRSMLGGPLREEGGGEVEVVVVEEEEEEEDWREEPLRGLRTSSMRGV